MTDRTAVELATEALRAGADYLDNLETLLIGINADMKLPPLRAPSEITKEFRSALAALTAEAAEPSDYHERHQVAEMIESARVSPRQGGTGGGRRSNLSPIKPACGMYRGPK